MSSLKGGYPPVNIPAYASAVAPAGLYAGMNPLIMPFANS
jgi:hypothetical protein